MMAAVILICLLLTKAATGSIDDSTYCVNETSVVYNFEGEPSVIGTLLNCLRAVQDGMIAPYYDTKARINVSTEVILNNLISINEVTSTVSLDFFFQTSWVSLAFATIATIVQLSLLCIDFLD